jgi:hypothetical protein
MAIFATMVGAVQLARVAPDKNLSQTFLVAARKAALKLAKA